MSEEIDGDELLDEPRNRGIDKAYLSQSYKLSMVWICPKHGETDSVMRLMDKHNYCVQCLDELLGQFIPRVELKEDS